MILCQRLCHGFLANSYDELMCRQIYACNISLLSIANLKGYFCNYNVTLNTIFNFLPKVIITKIINKTYHDCDLIRN